MCKNKLLDLEHGFIHEAKEARHFRIRHKTYPKRLKRTFKADNLAFFSVVVNAHRKAV